MLRGISFDVTRQKTLELELQQSQKLESVGRLASGVAHEINTPVQFVSDSIHFVKDGARDLASLIELYRTLSNAVRLGEPVDEAARAVDEGEISADLPFLLENVPLALDRSLDGLERIAAIVRSMKEFAHPDQREMTAVDLNHAIDNTLTIARSEYKYVAEVEREFGDLPLVVCQAGEVQPGHPEPHRERRPRDRGGRFDRVQGDDRIRTVSLDDTVTISVSDHRRRDPGRDREQDLRSFLHHEGGREGDRSGARDRAAASSPSTAGTITYETCVGRGTTFFVRLPIDGQKNARGARKSRRKWTRHERSLARRTAGATVRGIESHASHTGNSRTG